MEEYTPKEWEKSNLVVLKKLKELADITVEAISELDAKIDEINPAESYIYGNVDIEGEFFEVEGNSSDIAKKIRGNNRVTLVLNDDNDKIVYVDCMAKEYASNISSIKGAIMYDVNFDDGTVLTKWAWFSLTVNTSAGPGLQKICTLKTWEMDGYVEVPE